MNGTSFAETGAAGDKKNERCNTMQIQPCQLQYREHRNVGKKEIAKEKKYKTEDKINNKSNNPGKSEVSTIATDPPLLNFKFALKIKTKQHRYLTEPKEERTNDENPYLIP